MPDYQRLDDGNADGTQIGGAATDLIAFHGATPVDVAVIATLTGSTTLTAITATINTILSALVEKGLTSFT